MVLKTNSLFARAYVESPFFYMSQLIGKSFIFVQNAERANETFLKFEGNDPETKENAGIALVHFLIKHLEKTTRNEQVIKNFQLIFYQFQPNQKGEAKDYKTEHEKY